ncbi:MAG TPA: Na+/H+ antiporter subunit E [Sulfuricaulis sp.]|nr:Na+/H+ antiporter subunit E [Sulfuricaulis sp.]
MLRTLSLLLTLYAFWLLLSGLFTPFLLAAGVGCALAVMLLARRMDVIDSEGFPVQIALRASLFYWPWLVKEIIKSAWGVSRLILSPSLPISPTLVEFKPRQQTNLGLVVHANSITLTPGTITVELGRGRLLVHALTREAAAALENSEMDRRCRELESP